MEGRTRYSYRRPEDSCLSRGHHAVSRRAAGRTPTQGHGAAAERWPRDWSVEPGLGLRASVELCRESGRTGACEVGTAAPLQALTFQRYGRVGRQSYC
jgi:hypothetical protein